MKKPALMASLIGLAAGLGMMYGGPKPRSRPYPYDPKHDFDRAAKAEAKRQRKAAKLAKTGL
jgi:hypothetical protein